jgi:hypothetical protein
MIQTRRDRGLTLVLAIALMLILFESCKHDPEITPAPEPPQPDICDTSDVTYPGAVVPILSTNCYGCHGDMVANGGINLQEYETVATLAQNGQLVGVINHAPGFTAMPPSNKLDSCDIVKIETWVSDTTFKSSVE